MFLSMSLITVVKKRFFFNCLCLLKYTVEFGILICCADSKIQQPFFNIIFPFLNIFIVCLLFFKKKTMKCFSNVKEVPSPVHLQNDGSTVYRVMYLQLLKYLQFSTQFYLVLLLFEARTCFCELASVNKTKELCKSVVISKLHLCETLEISVCVQLIQVSKLASKFLY